MGGLCLTNRRAAILCALVVCCLVVSGPVEVKAEVVEDLETITIDPGEYHNVSLYLAQDEILYARFRITNGEGIYFFIVDQDGQDAIMNGSEPTTRYEEHTHPAQEARLNIVFFFATHDSTWYAWFSKVSGDPFADSAATIEGRVGRDIDGPVILETHIPDGPLTGTVEVSFSVRDDGFSINNVKLRDTTRNENSVYVLKVVAYDTWSHTSESAGVLRTVNNGFWDYPTNRMIVITAVVLGVVLGFAWYNKVNNTRLYSYVKSWNRRNWIELIIIVSIILLLILAGSQPVIF
jgi:hypothetical protein